MAAERGPHPEPTRPSPAVDGDHSSTLPRVSLTREEAAQSLGISLDSFERYVQGELRIVRRGRLRLVPFRDLEHWVEINAERPIVKQVEGEEAG